MTIAVTTRQRDILSFIGDFMRRELSPPTLREIGEHAGISSTNGTRSHLLALQAKGLLRVGLRSRSRDLRVTATGWELLGFKRCEHCGSFVEPGKAA